MIGALSVFAVATAQAAVTDRTSLYFHCDVPEAGRQQPRKLELTYFDPKISGAYALNYKDDDFLLPTREESKPVVANVWPTALVLAFPDTKNQRSRPLATVLLQPTDQPGRATLKLRWSRKAGSLLPEQSGTCSYAEGDTAEAEYRQVLAQ